MTSSMKVDLKDLENRSTKAIQGYKDTAYPCSLSFWQSAALSDRIKL